MNNGPQSRDEAGELTGQCRQPGSDLASHPIEMETTEGSVQRSNLNNFLLRF